MLKLHEVHSGTILNLRIGWLRLQVTVQDKWVIFFSTSLQCSKVPQVAPSLKHTDVTFHMYVKKAKIKNQDHLVVADCYCYKPAAFVDSLEGCSCEGLQFKVSTSASSKVLGSEGCGRFLPVRLFFLFFHYCALRHILPCVSVCRCARRSVSQFLVHRQDVWNAGNTYQHSSRVFVFQGYPATLMLLLHAEGEQLILRLEKNKWVFLSSVLKMPNLLHHMMSIYTHLPDLITNSQKRLAGVMWCVQGRIK